MSWSTELWDQFDTISNHTAKGIEFLEKLGHFVRDRCSIEIDYAGKLRKLAKNYDQTKKRDEVIEFTYYKAFSQLLKEVSDMAGQHEVVAENLANQIVKEISVISRDLKEERKRHLSEGLKYQNLLNMSLNHLDKSKKGYDKSFRESEKANENYKKADKDLNLSRAELEKAKTISLTKERACENSKTDYAKQLQVANQAQREHYTEFMPKVFQQLQDMENRRIECTKNFMKLSAIVQKNVMPIVNKCLDGVIDAANTINPNSDAQLVVDRYKSGMQPPDDIPFEDLSDKAGSCETESTQSKGSSLVYTHSLKSDSLRHTFTARGLRKRTKIFGIFGANKDDYSELPPNQRRKKIQAKLDQLNKEISQQNNEKDGLLVMKQAYEENGAFGDPKKIELQLRKNEQELDRLNKDLAKHLVLLDQLDELGFNNNKSNLNNNSNSHQQQANNDNSNNSIGATENESSKSPSMTNSNHRASIGHESQLSRTNSDNSIRPDNSSGNNNNNHNNSNHGDGTKSSATNRTSNSFADSLSDSVSNNANSVEVQDTIDGVVMSLEANSSQSTEDRIANHNNSNHNHHHYDCNTSDGQQTNTTTTTDTDLNKTNDAYETPSDLPVQAHAKALYPFNAEPAGSISMVENELFDVIEYDQGDGWTRVRRKEFNTDDDDFIGFVPTSYISINMELYPNQ